MIVGFSAGGGSDFAAPKRTPQAEVERFAPAIARGMQSAEVKARVAHDGSEAVGSTPQEFDRFLRSEMARFARVIRDAGIRAE
jgi:tripartite-type tricarboxylate transporter receptor subunit TctC